MLKVDLQAPLLITINITAAAAAGANDRNCIIIDWSFSLQCAKTPIGRVLLHHGLQLCTDLGEGGSVFWAFTPARCHNVVSTFLHILAFFPIFYIIKNKTNNSQNIVAS